MTKLIILSILIILFGVALAVAEKGEDSFIWLNEPRTVGTLIYNEQLHQEAYFASGVTESGISR